MMMKAAVKAMVSISVCTPIGNPIFDSSFITDQRKFCIRIDRKYPVHSFRKYITARKQIGIPMRATNEPIPAPVAPNSGHPQLP